MSTLAKLTSAAGLAALLITLPAAAGSITGDSFNVSMADDSETFELGGPGTPVITGTAGTPDKDILADILEVDWVDEDTFFVALILGRDFSNVKISLSDLNFKNGSNPVDITGVTFDDATTVQEDYDGFERIIGPTTAFTADSIEVSFATFPTQQAGDGISWYFDVSTSGTTAVPETLPGGMLFAAVGALALLRRRLR